MMMMMIQEQLAITLKPASTNTTAEFESIAHAAMMEEGDELRGQLKEATDRIAELEGELEVVKASAGCELENAEKIAAFGLEIASLRQENEKIAVLEKELEAAKEDSEKIAALTAELEAAKEDSEKIAVLEAELEADKENSTQLSLQLSNLQQEIDKTAALQTDLEASKSDKSEQTESETMEVSAGELHLPVEIRKPDVSKKMMRLVNKAFRDLMEQINNRPPDTEEEPLPENLKIKFTKLQRQALRFMMWRETLRPRGGILADGKKQKIQIFSISTNQLIPSFFYRHEPWQNPCY
jgi:DNA repair exonuclease SbcCD ATPase subunit